MVLVSLEEKYATMLKIISRLEKNNGPLHKFAEDITFMNV